MPKVVKVPGLGHAIFPNDMPDHEIAGHIAEHLDLPREDRIRGSADLPLTKQGRADAKELGAKLAPHGGFDHIVASPKKRTVATAQIVSPNASLTLNPKLEDMKYGEMEGEKSAEAIPHLNDFIVNKPDEKLPGESKYSGEKGESFNEYKARLIPAIVGIIHDAMKHPHEKTAIVLNRRSMKTFQAWMDAGHKDSLETNPSTATSFEKNDVPNGSIWKITDRGLEPVKDEANMGPGVYAMRHFSTHWNS